MKAADGASRHYSNVGWLHSLSNVWVVCSHERRSAQGGSCEVEKQSGDETGDFTQSVFKSFCEYDHVWAVSYCRENGLI